MITLRILKNLTFNSFGEVSKALAFIQRAIQDSLTNLDNDKATSLAVVTSDRLIESVQYNQHLILTPNAVATVQFPTAKTGAQVLGVTNACSGHNVVLTPKDQEKILSFAPYTLSPNSTVRLISDGRGGWW